MSTDLETALLIHKKENTPPNVIAHCRVVNRAVQGVWSEIKKKKPNIKADERLLSLGSLLHDIGRSKSHDIDHGIIGAAIIRNCSEIEPSLREKIARICETHLGAGISRKEGGAFGLPEKDYMPESLEEKIVAYCDNIVDDDEIRNGEWAVERFRKLFGDNQITKRVINLNKFINNLK